MLQRACASDLTFPNEGILLTGKKYSTA